MAVNFQPLDLALAAEVVANMWDRGKEEVFVFGMSSNSDVMDYIYERIDDPQAYIAMVNGKPIAAFGAFMVAPDCYRTWMVATDDFTNNFLSLTRKMKNLMEEQYEKTGATMIETFSASTHAMTAKWFKVLGLIQDETYVFGSGIRRFYKIIGE